MTVSGPNGEFHRRPRPFGALRDELYRIREPLRVRGLRRRLLLNASLHGIGQGKTLFLLGNGPSLSSQDLSALIGRDLMVTNSFFQHPLYKKLDPLYHVYLEPLERDRERQRIYLERMHDALVAGSVTPSVFLRSEYRLAMPELQLFERCRVYDLFVTCLGYAGTYSHGSIDLTKAIPGPNNVVLGALMIALYMRYSRIVLLGCDHDWLASPGIVRHFGAEVHQVDLSGIVGYNRESDETPYERLLHAVKDIWKSHRALRRLAENDGIQIVNASAGGMLDVYPVVALENETWESTV